MTLIVDAYNVTHRTGVLPPELAGIDVEGLAGLIAESRYGTREAILVCDGVPRGRGRGRIGAVRIRFSGHGRSADDLIRHLVDRSTTPKKLLVVSSDRAVLRAARRRRARLLDADAFLSQLALDARHRPSDRAIADLRGEVPLAPTLIEHWTEHFGLAPNDPDLELEAAPFAADLPAPSEPSQDAGTPSRTDDDDTQSDSAAPADSLASGPREEAGATAGETSPPSAPAPDAGPSIDLHNIAQFDTGEILRRYGGLPDD